MLVALARRLSYRSVLFILLVKTFLPSPLAKRSLRKETLHPFVAALTTFPNVQIVATFTELGLFELYLQEWIFNLELRCGLCCSKLVGVNKCLDQFRTTALYRARKQPLWNRLWLFSLFTEANILTRSQQSLRN